MSVGTPRGNTRHNSEQDPNRFIPKGVFYESDHTIGDHPDGHHDHPLSPLKPPPPPDEWANPCVVGLLSFGLTTMCIGLASTENLGIDDNPGLAMALVFGGIAQFIAGLIALRKGWIFPGTVFVCYGAFWMSLFMMLLVLPKIFDMPPKENDMLIFWFMWTLVTFSFAISAWKHGTGITVVFGILVVAILMLDIKQLMAIHEMSSVKFNRAIGWFIFFCGFGAWPTAVAVMTNNQYGKTLIPL